jgi:hypothetical protein
VESVGHAVVLAGLPDDRVGVVLAAVVDGHPHAQGEGGLAVLDRLAAVGVVVVGGDTELGVEPVEGLLGGPPAGGVGMVVVPVVMVELVGPVGVVLGPGAHLGVVGGQVGDGMALLPVVGVELEGLGGQLLLV